MLLDECLRLDFRHHFPNYDVHIVQWAGLKGAKNGELMRAAELADHNVLVTVDQGLVHQQPNANQRLSVILLRSRTNQLSDLMPLAEKILEALDCIKPSQTIVVSSLD